MDFVTIQCDHYRNILVSFLQTFGILLVVVGHSCAGASITPLWHTWIYSFHMPLFMFISGYLLKLGCERKNVPLAFIPLWGQNGFWGKKVRRLLIPYVIISTLAFLPKALLNRFAIRPIEISWVEYFNMLVYPCNNVILFFWFLPTLFIIFVVVILIAKVFRKTSLGDSKYSISLFFLLILHIFNPLEKITFLNLGGVCFYLFYFMLGYSACHFHIIDRIVHHQYIKLLISFFISVLFITVIPGFPCKDVLMSVNGIILSVLIAKIYCKYNLKFLNHLFGSSYAIYLFSWFFQAASQQLFLGITHAPWQIGSILAILTGVYVPWIMWKWIVTHNTRDIGRYVAFLVGH